MENYFLEEDIQLLCVAADFSENGISDAHKKIKQLVSTPEKRRAFGISYVNDHGIVPYDAALEQLDINEAKRLGLESFVLKKGKYMSILLENGKNNRSEISVAFSAMLFQKNSDPDGFCIELYLNDTDVQCMVRLIK